MGRPHLAAVRAQERAPRLAANFEPAAMIEVEISRPLPAQTPVDPDTDWEYRRAVVLVRLHSQPLGLIELALGSAGLSAGQLARSIWEALGPAINAHLLEDGLGAVVRLGPEGLSYAVAPACLEARRIFLASAPFVSVVVPTRDRPQQVAALVRSLLASDYPSTHYEIIVVDNAPSTNATARFFGQYVGDCPLVRYVCEERPGSSNARNRGLAMARGEIVVFADDDEMADRHWLTEMVRGFDAGEDVGCVTGLVIPMESLTQAQGWFEQFGGYCKEGCTPRLFDLTDHRAESPLYPYNVGILGAGGSMAFRRSILCAIGGFDPVLGPATPTLSGEDIDAMLRVILEGHTLSYSPAAIVRHPPHREYARLRTQIQGYGTGLAACLFKTLLTRPRLLPDMMWKLPRGLGFALSPRSPHHTGKRADFPNDLTWLELKGLLFGPLAYLRSRWRIARLAPQDAASPYKEPGTLSASRGTG
jgi:GT2 family glycosyltransferase